MSVDITTIFGTKITVGAPQLITERSFTAFPGASGVTSMYHGDRGHELVIRGMLEAYNYGTYNLNRSALQALIQTIQAYAGGQEIDLVYRAWTYYGCVMLPLPEGFHIIPGAGGKDIRSAGDKCFCFFESKWRML